MSIKTSQSNVEYFPTQTLYDWVTALLILSGCVLLISILFDYAEIQLLERAVNGRTIYIDEINNNDRRQQIIGILIFITTIPFHLVFITWFHRLYRNIRIYKPELEYKTWWAIWGFFIPVASIYIPYKIAREIYRVIIYPQESLAPALLKWWWGAVLISNTLNIQVLRYSSQVETPEQFIALNWLGIVSGIAMLIQYIFTWKLLPYFELPLREKYSNTIYDHNWRLRSPVETTASVAQTVAKYD